MILGRAIDWVERGRVPDGAVRWGIRRLCGQRLREEPSEMERERVLAAFAESMRRAPLAPVPEKANEQHYEVPAEFFARVLGPRRKYSCCYWGDGAAGLAEAEDASLRVTCARAGLADGMEVLELGCGWGSLTLWMAERFPASRITAVSNSRSQRTHIEARAAELGLGNVHVRTADMNDFHPGARFDRVVSVEMFEHMRNYAELLRRISSWLRPGGELFVHIFAHQRFAYPFESEGDDNWMGRHFFSGGIMPSDDLLARFPDDLSVVEQWRWSGIEYQRTADAWLANLDRNRAAVLPILARVYGAAEAQRWFVRWRLFFLGCAELFGYRGGSEWGVSHYRLIATG